MFETYLLQTVGSADDLLFYRSALDFRDQLYISKEQERKVALGCGRFPPVLRASLSSQVFM